MTKPGAPVGTVQDILETGGEAPVLSVRGAGAETLIPLAEAFVREVDLARGRIVVVRPASTSRRRDEPRHRRGHDLPGHDRGPDVGRHRGARGGGRPRRASPPTTCASITDDKHRTADDSPFGGGPGMVMKAEPFFRAVERHRRPRPGERRAVVLLSPRGRRFDQAMAARYAALDRLVLLCGRYEGIDERVREALGAEEVSVGDFVLTGGEVAALAVIEATVRLLPGRPGRRGARPAADSFEGGILDFPHYTRPAVVRGRAVPDVLLSGDHGRIRRWRRKEALRATRERRPDLLRTARAVRRGPGAAATRSRARRRSSRDDAKQESRAK